MRSPPYRAFAALLLAASPAAPGCTCSAPPPAPGAAASASSAAPAASSSAPEVSSQDTDVKPVYPPLQGPPHPLAARLCDALHDLPMRRQAECCQHPAGSGVAGECLRNLTGALVSGAVTLDEADIEKCSGAIAASLEGCDWVSPPPFGPETPPACLGILKGTRKTGEVCRSSLECAGNQFCFGAGPTSPGRCGKPRAEGPCSFAVDVLATHTRQTDIEQAHAPCEGYCDRRRCAPFTKAGGECKYNGQCGPGAHCDGGKCKAGEHGKLGEPCLGTRCAPGLRCDQKTCVAPRKEGERCERNEQCRGFCQAQDGGAEGTCSKRCSSGFATPRALPSASPMRRK